MQRGPKETEQELLSEIQKLLGTPEIILVRKWVEVMLEGAKDDLVNCPPGALERTQAEAVVYKNILRKLERMAYTNEQRLRK